ncbi:hypothetical protein SRA_09456 [Streptococcus ratti FA-1 = DSM 20564]|uniref:Uncharacterized protein n=1 Tax=Streptococcus ratti FA-1 = DSM 20564 TaxID=699248 RepID=A0ABN0GWN5_STRRT|nr:hypothetical protein SRA_09456 [Streptococcus ratti FA-1 = DSM 20564]
MVHGQQLKPFGMLMAGINFEEMSKMLKISIVLGVFYLF